MLGGVIAEADQALAVLLKTKVIGNAAIAITFDPPNRQWSQALTGPAVNLFLYDIKENSARREVMYEKVLGDNGVVVATRPPPPRFDLHYTVTAWAPKILVEHKILAAALRCFGPMTVLPREVLPATLAELPYEVLVHIESGAKRSMFINMGGDLKAGFEITVTVPMPMLPDLPAAPPVRQATVAVNPVPGADPARTAAVRETVSPQQAAGRPGAGTQAAGTQAAAVQASGTQQ
jgi:Pvc16 N-terminal domain